MLQTEPATAGADAAAVAAAPATNGAHQDGGGGGLDLAVIGEDDSRELGSGGSGGNRWPRQETLALLQIRSDMDAVFRDSSHKGPLWDEVSRKLAEMGYRRSAKKCREKFENVYKYHRRTKDVRAGKSDGKHYRFFDQLAALEANHSSSSYNLPPAEAAVPIAMAMPPPRPLTTTPAPFIVPSTTSQAITPTIHAQPAPVIHVHPATQNANYNTPMNFPSSPSGTPSSSSSTSSDEEIMGMKSRRKRKWKDFFEKLTKDVMEKQEELQMKFLEAIDKRENERRIREEAWKSQEIARLKREHEILVQERSMASAKETALISFLQKLSDHQQIPLPPSILQPQPPLTPNVQAPIPLPSLPISQPQETKIITPVTTPLPGITTQMQEHNGDRSSSRWPKEEIETLIKLRTNMDHKYQEGLPKGPLWEEISSAMKQLGYNRNAKRCKEKWENINKYFRKVKESNKKRREDAKTCPYYHLLEALYADKSTMKPPAAEPSSENEEDDDEAGGYEIVGNGGATSTVMEH